MEPELSAETLHHVNDNRDLVAITSGSEPTWDSGELRPRIVTHFICLHHRVLILVVVIAALGILWHGWGTRQRTGDLSCVVGLRYRSNDGDAIFIWGCRSSCWYQGRITSMCNWNVSTLRFTADVKV